MCHGNGCGGYELNIKRRVDLHIHTNISDGVLSPEEVIDEAVRNRVSVISITDHDTTEAYSDTLFSYAQKKGITLVSGVEISTKTDKAGIHVLGYHFDLNNKILKTRLYEARNTRHSYLHDVSIKLQELGYIVNVAELDRIDAVAKSHIAQDIVDNKENHILLQEVFGHIPARGEFIETIMNRGCPAYVKKKSMTPAEAASLIRQAGGKVVLAHPVAYRYEKGLTEEDIHQLVQEMQPDGIEANYIYIDRNHRRINETAIWNEFARQHQLHVTIGSDFHRRDGSHPEIGLANEGIEMDEKDVVFLFTG